MRGNLEVYVTNYPYYSLKFGPSFQLQNDKIYFGIRITGHVRHASSRVILKSDEASVS